jgi:hypothetical protein
MMQLESQLAESDSYGLGKKLSREAPVTSSRPGIPCCPGLRDQDPAARAGEPAGRLEMFRADLDLVAALRHPNIVDVVEVGALPNGVAFIVTELLEGRSLAERLAAGRCCR